MASFDSLVNGTHTLAMWTITVTGPLGKRIPRLLQSVRSPIRVHKRLRDRTGGMLELQRHSIGVPQDRHGLAVFQIHALHGGVQGFNFSFFEPARRLPRAEFRFVQNLVPRHAAQSGKRAD